MTELFIVLMTAAVVIGLMAWALFKLFDREVNDVMLEGRVISPKEWADRERKRMSVVEENERPGPQEITPHSPAVVEWKKLVMFVGPSLEFEVGKDGVRRIYSRGDAYHVLDADGDVFCAPRNACIVFGQIEPSK